MNTVSSTPTIINVGSRCSELALCQTHLVIKQLKNKHPNMEFNVIKMTTKGDQILDKALSKIGGKSLFTKELEVALDAGVVDFVVHSLKDLPTTLPPGLTVGAVVERDDPRDCVVLHAKHRHITRLAALPKGAVLGTSSLRRVSQLARHYPHLQFENIRGNLNTRLRKLDEGGKYDGIVLAAAGIDRLGWQDRVNILLEKHDMLYAVSQGAMAVECRDDDPATLKLLSCINHTNTAVRITAERTFMKALDGGCSVPIGTWSELHEDKITLSGAVYSVDGSEMLFSERGEMMPISMFGLGHCSSSDRDVIDMIHDQRPKLTASVDVYRTMINNNLIVHRTGVTCKTADVRKFDIAEKCGRLLAKSLLDRGAKDVLDRARAAGIDNINQAPGIAAVTNKPTVSETEQSLVQSTSSSSSSPREQSLDNSGQRATKLKHNPAVETSGPPAKRCRRVSV